MVLFVTITIANVLFYWYWAIVLHVQFLFMNFLFVCVSLWLSPSRSEAATRAVLRKVVLRNFAKSSGNHLWQSLFFDKVVGLKPATLLKKRLWHRPSPLDFVKYLKTPFFYRTPLVAASARYRWLGSSSSFQVVPVRSRWFQLVTRFRM